MHKNIRKWSGIISVFTILCISSHGAEIDDDWEIVTHDYNAPDCSAYNTEEDFELKVKAFGNTVISVVEGSLINAYNIALNHATHQFSASVAHGTHVVGNIYGQGLALQSAYENEKSILKREQDK